MRLPSAAFGGSLQQLTCRRLSTKPGIIGANSTPRRHLMAMFVVPLLLIVVAAAAAAQAATQDASAGLLPAQNPPLEQQPKRAVERRSNLLADQLDSAELPAEFRDEPREQSKLAKLCQQTSSVLASVLPAPFGGHKRSILCQFFGQVPLGGAGQAAKTASKLRDEQQQQVAVLQQAGGQQPVTMLMSGRHPIELVLEQQQRLMQQQQHQQRQVTSGGGGGPVLLRPGFAPAQPPAHFLQQQDLKSSASVLDYAYHQKLEPPPQMQRPAPGSNRQPPHSPVIKKPAIKYNQPAEAAPFKPSSVGKATAPSSSQPLVSTSGWRIFNQSLVSSASESTSPTFSSSTTTTTTTTTTASPSSATTAAKASLAPKGASTTLAPLQIASNKQSPASEIVIVRPVMQANQAAMAQPQMLALNGSLAKRSEALRTTTPRVLVGGGGGESQQQVRTIEVSNASASNSSFAPTSSSTNETRLAETSASGAAAAAKLAKQALAASAAAASQVQKREELVIASINNLTRIAFGNQLRDTVKVINKLIEQQQSDLMRGTRTIVSPNSPMQFGHHNSDLVQAESQRSSVASSRNSQALAEAVPSGKSSGGSRLPIAGTTAKPAAAGLQLQLATKTAPPRKAATAASKTSTSAPRLVLAKPTKKAKKPLASDSLRLQPLGQRAQTPLKASAGSYNRQDLSQLGKPASAGKTSSAGSTPKPASAGQQRSLWSSSSSSSTTTKSTADFVARRQPAVGDDEAIRLASTMADIHRDHQPWQSSPAAQQRLLARPVSEPAPYLRPLATAFTRRAPYSSPAGRTEWRAPSTLPWLLPDKSSSPRQEEPTHLIGAEPSNQVLTTSSRMEPAVATTRKWATRSTASLVPAATRPLLTQVGSSSKQALVLNRLDGGDGKLAAETTRPLATKMDSLATLKMSLMTTAAPATVSTQQSRWIPTLLVPSSSSSASTSANTTTTTTTAPPTTTTATTRPPTTVATSTKEATQTVTGNLVEISSEARASDSISRFTSHLSDANEMLATTRRAFRDSLPQIAQTGEFFNAETIASWPEKYQTMLEEARQSTPALQQQQQPETTRRNGEAYETTRHRVDDATTTTTRIMQSGSQLASFTVLPPNHKLTTTADGEQATATTRMAATSSSPLPLLLTRQSPIGPAVAYTLVGPITKDQEAGGEELPLNQETMVDSGKFPFVSVDEVATTSAPAAQVNKPQGAGNATAYQLAAGNHLKAPYLQQEQTDALESVFPFEQPPPASRPYVSRKLYELLVPSTRQFVGQHNPLNQQRFNLSALKFLAQNLLSPASFRSSQTSNETELVDPGQYQMQAAGDQASQQASSNDTSQQQQQLLALLESSNYYDLLANETSSQQQEAAGGNNKTAARGETKTILSRASNLLNDLRQMEQKKAAAILAAIRYQVPSPLVRPWDLNSDLLAPLPQQPDGSLFMNDRSEEDQEQVEHQVGQGGGYLRDSLLLAQASRLIKAALAKQRLVSRDVLEARLNGKAVAFLDKRSDDQQKPLEKAYSFGDNDNQAGVFNGSRHDDADYVPVAQDNPNNGSRNLTRRWLGKLFSNRNNSSSSSSSSAMDKAQLKEEKEAQQGSTARSSEKSEQDHHLVSANETDLASSTSSSQRRLRIERNNKAAIKDKKENEFDCSDKQAGFYPDSSSACQTFYHCSNTGHLLTFNCPQQTRFDEKSLKCGPWFEITCDLARAKQRRPFNL